MRRIAILAIGLFAVLPAFGQTTPPVAVPGAAPPAASGPHPKSKEENAAVLAMGKAPDPDARIAAAQNVLTTFPDTDYKSIALLAEAQAYHDKRDDPKAIVFGEQAVDADAKNFEALLLLSDIYSQTTRSTDLDMEDKLVKSDKYAKDALVIIPTVEKPSPAIPDADWARAQQGEEGRAWEALGFAAILRKKFDEAKTDVQKSLDLAPDPVEMLRIGRAWMDAKRYDDAIALYDRSAASPGVNDQIKKIAASYKARAEALKKQP